MKAVKFAGWMLLAVLAIGVGANPARALELFTNFNDGMELNWRPYGIPDNAPARYQSGHPCVNMIWRYPARGENCRVYEDSPEYSSMEGVSTEPRGDRPTEIHATQAGIARPRSSNDEDWMRGASFLPNDSKNHAVNDSGSDYKDDSVDEGTDSPTDSAE